MASSIAYGKDDTKANTNVYGWYLDATLGGSINHVARGIKLDIFY